MDESTSVWTLARVEHNPNVAIIYKLATNPMGTRQITLHVPFADLALFQKLVREVPRGSKFNARLLLDAEGKSHLTGFEAIH